MSETLDYTEATPQPAVQTSVAYAGFWIRFLAAIIDSILVYGALYLIRHGDGSGFLSNVTSMVVAWLYYALLESSPKQATIGKMVVGIIVTDENGKRISIMRATGRYFAKILSAVILCIGFIMIAFTEKKQGLHDMLADTLVIKVK